ncbi:MAG: phenylalanine--tRNA ligase subunit beta [Bacteroidia bacterium]
MKISYNWLKNYISTDISAQEAARLLTFSGLEVENIEIHEKIQGGLKGLVIGEVLTCDKHPDADKLSLTTVSIGNGQVLQIVCGAPNVAAGQKVVVATVGTTLYPTNGEPFTIKKTKIRGAVSEGMICAEDEIGIGTSHAGIMVLPADTKVGIPAADYFNLEADEILEIGLTPNRADAASHIGVARDLAAIITQQLKKKTSIQIPSVENFKEGSEKNIEIEIQNTQACKRYSGLLLKNVKVAESPEWLKQKISSIGLRPINNVVDITNFVLHETGQPLHAFDASKISGNKIIVRNAKEGEKFITLDEVERSLHTNDLMIADNEKSLCIAGVFGGLHSGVTTSTTEVFLESAWFDASAVRKSSKNHGLKTDASFRFERGTDPNMTIYALKRAALLLQEIASAEIASPITDIYPHKQDDFKVTFSFTNCKRLIGKEIPKNEIKNILSSLEIKILSEDTDTLELAIPPYKVDVTREADVIEEILRIYGYNNVEIPTQVKIPMVIQPKPDKEKIRKNIADLLVYSGLTEILNNSLTKTEYAEKFTAIDKDKYVAILNALSSDLKLMRQTLLFGGLESIAYNLNRKQNDIKFFEFGNIYCLNNEKEGLKKYSENPILGIWLSGNKQTEQWNAIKGDVNFYTLKNYVENILERLGIKVDKSNLLQHDLFDFGLELIIKQKTIAKLGAVNKKILKHFDINQSVWYAEIDMEQIFKSLPTEKLFYKEVSKYPEVRRDLALLIDKTVSYAQIESLAYQTEKNILKKVGIFDVYEGKNIQENKKSYALSFILQDEEKTLNDKQIEKTMEKLLQAFKEKLGAELRA